MTLKTCLSPRLAWLLALTLAACLDENPTFDGPASATTSGAPTSASTSTATAVTTVATSSPQTTGATMGGSTTSGASSTAPLVTSSGAEMTSVGTAATTGAPGQVLELVADQAGCYARRPNDTIEAWIAECESVTSDGNSNNNIGELVVDGENSDFGDRETYGLLRFPWPAQLDGKQVLALELRLVATDHDGQADSDSTGELWLSGSFDLDTPEPMTAPALDLQLGPDAGAVELNDVIVWTLSPDLLVPGAPTHLQIAPASNDGVNYWNLAAPTDDARPRLLVTYSD